MMAEEDELNAVKKSIEKLDNLCKVFEGNPALDGAVYNPTNYQSWQKQLAALREKENLLLAQQQAAGMLS
jgi:hypothetical protein